MTTKILSTTKEDISIVCVELKKSGIVAFPTETVYGLAANAFDEHAIKKIFSAKGRPQDNPLIVHISDMQMLPQVVSSVPKKAKLLMDQFCPGPLTVIMPKSEQIPTMVTAGLCNVAVRMPAHPVAREIIAGCGFPLAAPSANLSGSPSPTTAKHVFDDLNGIIPFIIDGGYCEVGLESTVVTAVDDEIRLLRPGAITIEMLEKVVGRIIVDDGVLNKLKDGVKVTSPGLKYQHYAPKAKITMINSDLQSFINYARKHGNDYCNGCRCCNGVRACNGLYALVFEGEEEFVPLSCVTYGMVDDEAAQAKELFSALRKLDEKNAKVVFARAPKQEGVGLAVYNRLLRAAGFNQLTIDHDTTRDF